MRHAGGVRIDHAMGLARLWVIPDGGGAQDGVYLHYPMQALMGLLAERSRRHRAIVIGEDLGTVPDGFRDAMRGAGMLGMEVLWFQRDGRYFRPAERWSAHAAALTTTHDLPTVAGWWRGRDIDWLEKLGRKSEYGDIAAERWARGENRTHLWSVIGQGPEPSPENPEKVVEAVLAFVGRTPNELALALVEDVLNVGRAAEHFPARSTSIPIGAGACRRATRWPAPRHAPTSPRSRANGSGRDAARDLSHAVPQGLHVRGRRGARALSGRARHQPSLCIAHPGRARRLDAWL